MVCNLSVWIGSTVRAMSEGRLAPVRETDRHASLAAGGAGAACCATTFAALYGLDVHPNLGGDSTGAFTSFPFFTAVAAGIGLIVGCIEGGIAARAARKAADRFASLPVFSRKVFILAAIANAGIATLAVVVTYTGSALVMALAASVAVALGASAFGAAVFGWSHAVDWPHVPDYMKANIAAPARQPRPTPRPVEREVVDVDIEAERNEVVHEPRSRSRRNSANVDDEVWQDIQDLITGK